MKYLKKFNERLRYDTYMSASDKLKEIGHDKRSDDLKSYANTKSKGIFDHLFKIKNSVCFIDDIRKVNVKNDVNLESDLQNVGNNIRFKLTLKIVSGKFDGLYLDSEPFKFASRKDAMTYKKYLIGKFPEYRKTISDISTNVIYS